MIEVAKHRSGQSPTIEFQVADIMQWEFPVEQLDEIVLIILDLLEYESLQDSLSDLIMGNLMLNS